MGQDYGARKAAKRRRKGNRAAEGAVDVEELDGLNAPDDESHRRERKKRPKVNVFPLPGNPWLLLRGTYATTNPLALRLTQA
eukprot:scaffold441897_cov15-Prasinocladus_malaysianus.AAC.1